MLQFITHHTEQISYLESVRIALAGGCRWVQLRMKEATPDEIRPIALQVQEMCQEARATFIIDDHVALVKELHADGVHLGKNDMPIAEARKLLGEGYIIGGTANTFADVEQHYRDGANYIGCGPFRFTTTKANLSPILGLEGYREIIQQMREAHINLPIVGIGGIEPADIPGLLEVGLTGVALSGTILRAEDPIEQTRKILRVLGDNRFSPARMASLTL